MTGLLSKIIIPIVKRSSKASRDYPDLTLKSRKEGLAEKFLDEHNYEKYSPSSGDTKPTKPHYVEQDDGKIIAYTPLGGTKNKFEQKSFNNPTLKSLRNWMGYSAGGKVMQRYNEGGSLMMPPEMMEEESIQEPVMDVPEDTYQSEDPIEVAASQESDEVIEQDQMEMVLGQALDSEEQQYLMNALEGDEQLSQIFDKVLMTASEFSGEGEVDGLGDGTSDSIPARLSDGEFVMTKKATDQIGSDNLQIMMDDAERAYDGGEMRDYRYGGGLLNSTDTTDLSSDTENTDEEIRKLMGLRANQAPSLR